jgi:NAD(P)-dependent dehydrogenase (short-subunit alcohol dehydrogenase family)
VIAPGQGIGRAIALRLAKDGTDIAIVDLYKEKMAAVAKEVQALSRKATIFVADVSSRDQVYAYCPGFVGTDMWVEIDEHFAKLTGAPKGATYEKYVAGITLGRSETPDDVAAFVSYPANYDTLNAKTDGKKSWARRILTKICLYRKKCGR